ncbi:MAG: rRNA methyltransferase [Chloroflexi bacterium]|nr:MAG: rRNA methyltransferase [Chloroflexota bacterium]
MPVPISSLSNKQIKQVVKLNTRRARSKHKLTLVEGIREISQALENGVQPCQIYYCPHLIQNPKAKALLTQFLNNEANASYSLYEVTPQIFQKIAYRGESGGLLLVIPYSSLQLEELILGNPPFIVIIENVEKPGNLGGILRTADAAGADCVIVCFEEKQPNIDIYNPNVIRASLGALFSVPTVAVENGRLLKWLSQNKIKIITTTPTAPHPYTTADLTGAIAIVMGSEAHGLSQTWLNAKHNQVTIPMFGKVDSLNLSVSTGLLLYEVIRQRTQPVKQAKTVHRNQQLG